VDLHNPSAFSIYETSIQEIPLSKGYVALVDATDFEFLNELRWYAAPHGRTLYAVHGGRVGRKTRHIFMHRLILNNPRGMATDHIDGNGLNNTRANLRIANPSQNTANKRKWHRPTTSQYKGVNRYKGRWRAYICNQHLGIFDDEIEAALAYNEAALVRFGEFARLNEV